MRSFKLTLPFLLGLAVATLAGCGDEGDTGGGPPVFELRDEADAGLLLDPVTVDSAWVDESRLVLDVSYGGGCREHGFRAIAPRAFLESYPPQLPVYLQHDANEDDCRSIVRDRLEFDIEPALSLYLQHHVNPRPFLLRLSIPGSGGVPQTIAVPVRTAIGASPYADAEAEEAAVVLSGTGLVAPPELYAQVLEDLRAIRAEFGGADPDLRAITFQPPWSLGQLRVILDGDAAAQVAAGTYRDWDGLNEAYDLASIEALDAGGRVFLLTFRARLQPDALSIAYFRLRGVEAAEPVALRGEDGRSKVFPYRVGTRIHYLFRKAGRGHSQFDAEYVWFEDTGNGHSLIGQYSPLSGPPQPAWFNDALRAVSEYNELIVCCRRQ